MSRDAVRQKRAAKRAETRRKIIARRKEQRELHRRRELERREEQKRMERERRKAEQAKRKKENDRWRSDYKDARTGAYDRFRQYFQGRLGNAYGQHASDGINRLAERLKKFKLGDDLSAIDDELIEDIWNEMTDDHRDAAKMVISKQLPVDFEYSRVGDTADDDILEQVLAEQRAKQMEALERARDRNQVNDTGYQGGLENLNEQMQNAQNFLQTYSQEALENQRQKLRDIAARASGQAQQLNLGQAFNINPYQQQIQQAQTDFFNNQKGNLASQTGDLFNIGDMIGNAFKAQGQQNLGQEKAATSGIKLNQNQFIDPEEDRQQENIF